MTLQLALFFETTFLDIYESFEKYSKQNLEMAESSRSLNPNKKKAKRSKLAGALSTKTTTFKSEWKKEFPLITRVPNDYFFCNIIKCAVFLLIMKFGRYYYGQNLTFYIILLICFNLNLQDFMTISISKFYCSESFLTYYSSN